MNFYKAVVTEETSPLYGKVVANTKSSLQYKGMDRKQFEDAVKYISVFTIKVVEI